MGLFDTFFGGKENPNQTIYDPTAEERKRAMAMALLQGGAGILANNRGHYGQFAPAFGAGVSQGIQGYQQGLSEGPERRMKEMQQQLYAQQVNAQMQRAKADNQDDEIARGTFQTVFQDSGYDPETGGFMNVSNTPQPIKSSPVPFLGEGEMPLMEGDLSYTPPPKANPMDAIIDELGWTPGRKKFFMAQYKADPKSAMKNLQSAYIEMDRSSRKGKAEARDVLAKEKAIQDEIDRGTPLGKRLLAKQEKSGVNLNVSYGAPIAATDSQGNPVFIRPPKDGMGAPVVMEGYTPPEKPTEAEAKSATFHQQMNAASNELQNIEKSLDVTSLGSQLGVRMAGGLTNPLASKEAQRYRQAQEQWSEAFLRIKTGAAATQDEVDRNITTFFPQIGDSAEVIAQKKRQRVNAERDVKSMAGTAMRRIERTNTQPQSGTVRKYNPATGRIE